MTNTETQSPARLAANDSGRADILAWADASGENVFTSDTHFRRVLALYANKERLAALEDELTRFGAEVAGPIDALVCKNNEPLNLPRLDRWSDYGERTERIDHHPTYHEAGRYIYGSGVMEAYRDHPNAIGALSRFYISSYNGEAGHNCPLACTAGVIRVLQELGSPMLKDKYLPGLLNRDYGEHLEGAQFLTEIQGGSDVGANAVRAEKAPDGTWRIHGEKWFCSNIDADIFLMTARPYGAADGTAGLGLFLVPRTLDDGSVNEFYIRRLKEKLGTRSMASGECDFNGALAYHMGPLGSGFKNMMGLVINTSRLYNAVGTCAVMRRAFLVARGYAHHRQAFGTPIVNYPLVQETLADVRAEIDAMVSGTFHLAAMQDRLDRDQCDTNEQQFFRVALNVNKSLTAQSGRWACVQGIEILGGNGAIESFSVLPRLLRDSIVYENWEGTHNTLFMQVYRDMHRYRLHEGFIAYLRGLLDEARADEGARAGELDNSLSALEARIDEILEMNPASASLAMRPLAQRMAYLMYACVRTWERTRQAPADDNDEASLEHFLDLRLRASRTASDARYLERIAMLAQ
ncbi:MAG: acyl-CoA dehydrogenase family protein [Bradymonadaceae bacterium]|nr:acyl-CoA dehydrogenase family protein [Lujinxingiaceae bacterium]